MTLLSIRNLKSYFVTRDGVVKAVNQVSLDIFENETLGLVGESGCGKTVLALSILRLLSENTVVEGKISFKGNDLLRLNEEGMRDIRGKEIAQIFQNPLSSLNPVLTIGLQVSEPFMLHRGMKLSDAWQSAISMLRAAKIPSPAERGKEYPHQFSGGMRQRAMISMGLACNPALILADEPTKGLDVTIQSQIIELMRELVKDRKASMLLITHDLAVAAELCDRIAVMYSGEIVEVSEIKDFLSNPGHPYCRGLLRSLPLNGMEPIPGNSPSLIDVPEGCRFHPRCKYAMERCRNEHPEMYEVGNGRKTRCFLYA
ncbi:MAG: ABC transporter ATP-binding protein [Euryarchaeota archaeon]|nr:ABC transporter ATP-binding protein [Euryarchaeota archaeon]